MVRADSVGYCSVGHETSGSVAESAKIQWDPPLAAMNEWRRMVTTAVKMVEGRK